MIFQFLGTSAGEQYPALWCRCENCQKARKRGGRNIRRNSCAWISPNIMLDFSPDVFTQAERFGIDLIDLEYLFITHSHGDHFNLFPFGWRYLDPKIALPPSNESVAARFTPLKTLNIVGNHLVCRALDERLVRKTGFRLEEHAMKIHQAEPFREDAIDGIKYIPLRANHFEYNGERDALNYILFLNGKTILYALDTGWFLPETYEIIRRYQYDLAVVEGTFGHGAEWESHMNFRKLENALSLFKKDGLLKPGAPFCASHLAPHFSPVHDEIEPALAEKGITVAYDGMKLEI